MKMEAEDLDSPNDKISLTAGDADPKGLTARQGDGSSRIRDRKMGVVALASVSIFAEIGRKEANSSGKDNDKLIISVRRTLVAADYS